MSESRSTVAVSRHCSIVCVVLLVLLAGGKMPASAASNMDHSGHAHSLESEQNTDWTCSMHPHIRREGAGRCPICGMDLIPVQRQSGDQSEPQGLASTIRFTNTQRALMKIETALVERRFPTATLRLVGKVTYDETRLEHISAWVAGRIEKLFVNYTGLSVNKGDHMVDLYSPELLSAQDELIQALRGMGEGTQGSRGSFRESSAATVQAARNKLRRYGLTEAQIARIESSGTTMEDVTIFSPASGVVIDKAAEEGMYVDTGSRLFTIADLSTVWVQLDAYESDLQWLHYGQPAQFTTEAFPGKTFDGKVAFIDPVIDPHTRTVQIRLNVDNRSGELKPGMFVRAKVSARLAEGGKVVDQDLAGKWISPMHPEVIQDEPGSCPVCGMDLVSAESLGFSAGETSDLSDETAPLVIPASAALLTGKRAVVYVEKLENGRPVYAGREVVLGPRAGNDYIVASGLMEGERVVVSGNFKIDSALQIQAKPSMMNPEAAGAPGHQHHH